MGWIIAGIIAQFQFALFFVDRALCVRKADRSKRAYLGQCSERRKKKSKEGTVYSTAQC